MSLWQKFKAWVVRFMEGRYGMDDLGTAMLFTGLILAVADMFVHTGILSLVGEVLYILMIYRMFSKQREKRLRENQRFVALTSGWRTKARQFWQRQKNRKQYKYFRCPKCRAMLRLTRGCGKVHVTCARCGHEFEQNA